MRVNLRSDQTRRELRPTPIMARHCCSISRSGLWLCAIAVLLAAPINALEIFNPSSIAGVYPHETASFGPPPGTYAVNGNLMLSDPENACTSLRWSNATALSPFAGAIVLAVRGNCSFVTKAMNIQAAGAVGAVIGNFDWDSDALHQMGAHGSTNVSIPSVFIITRDYISIVSSSSFSSLTPLAVSSRVSNVGESTSASDDRNLASLRIAFYLILSILFVWFVILGGYWLRRRCLEVRHRESRMERYESLPTHLYSEIVGDQQVHVHNTDCCICLEPFQLDSHIKILPCSHGFHNACIEPWMQQHDACPVCRTSIRD